MIDNKKLGRRKFLAVSGGLTAAAAGALSLTNTETVNAAASITETPAVSVPQWGQLERFSLDLGHRASRGGPIAATSGGKLIWITTEPEAPYLSKSMWKISRLVMRTSTDGGRSWHDPKVLQQGTVDYSLLSHTIKETASGSLLHIFVRYSGYDYDTGVPEKSLCEIFTQRSIDGGNTWSQAQKMETGERYHGDILSLEQLRDGRLVYPMCFLTNVKSQFAVSAMYSDDDGKSWKRSPSVLRTGGGGFESGASEPTITEMDNGNLWMLIRAQTGFLWESYSFDRGETWTPAQPSLLPSSNAPATAIRLRDGNIAVAWNPHVNANYARQSLVVGLTRDGKNFHGLREIDFTDFTDDPAASIPHVTYSYLSETKEGDIAISYNKGNWSRHNRPSFARVTRSWILEKNEVADLSSGRTGWHTIDPGPRLAVATERYILSDDGTLWLEIEQHPRNQLPTGIVRNIPLVTDGEVIFQVQAGRSDGFIMLNDSLLSPRDASEACLRFRFAKNKIYLGAGEQERIQNNRRTTEYNFLSNKIKKEVEYPAEFKPETVLNVSVKYNSGSSTASVSVNGGKTVELTTGKILGLSFLGMMVTGGGSIRISSVKTIIK